jgi:RNA polymerase sigma-B factor
MEGLVRPISEQYLFANPFLEPISLDQPAPSADEQEEALGSLIPDTAPDLEEVIERSEIRAAVLGFMNGLRDRDRLLLESLFWMDSTQADVARQFQVSGASVSKQLRRILAKARHDLAYLSGPALFQ